MSLSMTKRFKYWLIERKRAMVAFGNRMRYHWNGGYECHSCGTLIPIYYDHISSEAFGKKMIIQNSSEHLYCAHCLGEKIQTYFRASDSLYPLVVTTCDWTGKQEKTIGIIWGDGFQSDQIATELDLDVRFGSNYWNGHRASLRAFRAALIENEPTYAVSYYKSVNGRMYGVDKNGIKVDCK